MSTPCRCQQAGFRSLISAKLGRCPRCIRAAFLGTLVTWVAVAVVLLMWPGSVMLLGTLAVAVSFTGLLLGHVAALTVRTASLLGSSRATPPALGGRWHQDAGRRQFLIAVGRFSAGALFAAIFGAGVTSRATAQGPTACQSCVEGCIEKYRQCIQKAFHDCFLHRDLDKQVQCLHQNRQNWSRCFTWRAEEVRNCLESCKDSGLDLECGRKFAEELLPRAGRLGAQAFADTFRDCMRRAHAHNRQEQLQCALRALSAFVAEADRFILEFYFKLQANCCKGVVNPPSPGTGAGNQP